jgi:formate dehydrogenase maturation protein FdhE
MRYTSPQTCVHCEQEKDLGEFHFKSSGYIMRICKPCNVKKRQDYVEARRVYVYDYNRKRNLWKKFKITLEDYQDMHDEQGGVCKICGTNEDKRMLAVDHCHETGKVRDLLCTCCNTGLGKFRDNPDLLIKAVEYLEGDV